MFSEAAETILLYFIFEKKEKEGKEGEPVTIFVVSLPIPNITVLGIFLAGKYWTVFIPGHPIAWLLSQQEGLMSCASESTVLPSNISSWGWIYHQEDVWDPKPHIFALLYQKWLFTKQGNCSHPTHTTKTKITFQNELSTASKPWAGFEPGFWKRRVKKRRKQMQLGEKQKHLVSLLEQDDLPWNITALRHIIASFSGAFRLLASPIYFHTETRL